MVELSNFFEKDNIAPNFENIEIGQSFILIIRYSIGTNENKWLKQRDVWSEK